MRARTLLLPLPAPAAGDALRALDPEARALVEALTARLAANPGERALLDALAPVLNQAAAAHADRPLVGEASVRAVLDGAIDAWFVLRAVRDARGRIADFVVLDMNAAAEAMVSRSRVDVVGHPICELEPTHRTNGLFGLYVRVAERGEAAEVEIHVGTRRLQDRWLRVRAMPMSGGIAVVAVDATAQHRAEEEARAAERRWRDLMTQVADAVLVVDRGGVVRDANAAAAALFGDGVATLAGASLARLLVRDGAHQPLRLDRVPEDGALVVERRLRGADGDGPLATLAVSRLDADRLQVLVRPVSAAGAPSRVDDDGLRGAFDDAPTGIALLSPDGRWLRVNRALCAMLGHAEGELLGRRQSVVTHPADATVEETELARLLDGTRTSFRLEKRFVHREGHVVWATVNVSLARDGDGSPRHFVAHVEDATERKRVEQSRARLAAILEQTPDVVAMSTVDGRLLYLNRAGRALLGLADVGADAAECVDTHDAIGVGVPQLQPQFAPDGAQRDAIRTAARTGSWRGETTLRKRDGRELPVEQVIIAHPAPDGTPAYYSTIIRDISERKQAESTLRALSLVDPLTSLYNRRGFLTVAEQALLGARERCQPVLAFYLDMDDFKAVNDVHGHAAGDAALVAVADILRHVFRESDVVGRIGGDEFVALVVHGGGATSETIRSRIQRRLAEHNHTVGQPCALSVSIGIAAEWHAPDHTPASLDALLAEADAALHEEKLKRRRTR